MKKIYFSILIVISFLSTQAQYVTLDNTFGGGDGIVIPTLFGTEFISKASCVAVDASGNSYYGGTAESGVDDEFLNYAVCKLSPTGNLLNSWSGDGMLLVDAGSIIEGVEGIDVYSNGRLLICGTVYISSLEINGAVVFRTNSNGSIDGTFNNDEGQYYAYAINGDANLESVGCVVLDNNQGIVAYAQEFDGMPYGFLDAFNNAGDLDPNFGIGGSIAAAPIPFILEDIADDGTYVYVCGIDSDFEFGRVLKIGSDGNYANGFGEDNGDYFSSNIEFYPTALDISSTGDIFLLDGAATRVIKMDSEDGMVDESFNNNFGYATLGFQPGVIYQGEDITVLPNGHIVIAGSRTANNEQTSFLAMFDEQGILVSTFGTNGIYTPELNTASSEILAIDAKDDMRIYAAGGGGDPNDERFMCSVYSNAAVSVEESSNAIVKIYPNPAQDRLFIQTQNRSVMAYEVYDIFGKTVLQSVLPVGAQYIDVSNLSSGQFVLVLHNEEGEVYKAKMIKQ
jgi:hypothetical protein